MKKKPSLISQICKRRKLLFFFGANISVRYCESNSFKNIGQFKHSTFRKLKSQLFLHLERLKLPINSLQKFWFKLCLYYKSELNSTYHFLKWNCAFASSSSHFFHRISVIIYWNFISCFFSSP